MGTSPLVKNNKTLARNQILTAWVDEADNIPWISKDQKPKEYLEFNDDPLALVCAMIRAGKEYYEIGSTLEGVGTRLTRQIPINNAIETQDKERALTIRKHFRNKILMRRLKNMNMSQFMCAVDDLIESPQRIEKQNVRPLLKLPDFYEEDKLTESIFNSHKSLPEKKVDNLDTVIEYVDTVKQRNSRNKVDIQYWRTPNDYLVRLVFPLHDMGKNIWEFLAQKGSVHIETENSSLSKVQGYDYFVYGINSKYKIKSI